MSDIIKFTEEYLGFKLYPFQKEFLETAMSEKKFVLAKPRSFRLQVCRESLRKYRDLQLKPSQIIVDDVENIGAGKSK